MGNSSQKKIITIGLAVVVGFTCGIAFNVGAFKDNVYSDGGKLKDDFTVVWTGDDVADFSYMLGGFIGHYDYLNDKEKDYTNNSYYEKYYEYVDLLQYISGYKEGYQDGGMFISYEDSDEIIKQSDKNALVFKAMADGIVKKQYTTTEPDKVRSILHPEENN